MKSFIVGLIASCLILGTLAEETRLIELEPDEAAQIINKQDQSLRYAPKIESNVPGVRVLGDHPEHVVQDIYLANQYHGQDGLGAYVYGYAVPDIAKTEKKERSGDLRGAYNYIAEDGQEIKVQYWDDGTGFHQIDNIPKIQPKQVEDSPEVKAAKEEHLRIWHEQAERNSHAPDPNANQYNQPQQPVPNQYQQYQGQVQYQPQQQPYSSQTPGVTHYQASQGQVQVHGQVQSQPRPIGQDQPIASQYSASSAHVQGQQSGGLYGQYQGQVQPQHGGAGGAQISPNSVEYSGQYSANQPTRVQGPGGQQASGQYAQSYGQGSGGQQQAWAQGSGKQEHQEEEEQTGPPKGFFYSFDYAVPIIVGREGKNLEAYYSQNKNLYEKQLKGEAPSPAGASSSYHASA